MLLYIYTHRNTVTVICLICALHVKSDMWQVFVQGASKKHAIKQSNLEHGDELDDVLVLMAEQLQLNLLSHLSLKCSIRHWNNLGRLGYLLEKPGTGLAGC